MSNSENPNQQPQRLLSTRSKAKLTPGTKPKFAINKNVVRKKQEPEASSLLENIKPKSRDSQVNKKTDRPLRKRPEIVYTTTGLFSQGPASVASVGTSSRHYSGSTNSSRRGTGFGPKAAPGSRKSVTREDADQHAYGKHQFLFDAKPNERTVSVQQLDTDITVKTVKNEVKTESDESIDTSDAQPMYSINADGEHSQDAQSSQSDVNPWPKPDQFIFLHLPPQLPKPLYDAESETNEPIEIDTKSDQEHQEKAEHPDVMVGKLRRYKSGKVQLVYGNLILDITKSQPIEFLQKVMAVDANPKNGFLAHLGNVNDRLVATPNIESMLGQLTLDSNEMKIE